MIVKPPPSSTTEYLILINVILFKESGKYYTEEQWQLPTRKECETHPAYRPGDYLTPYVMRFSPDFRRIGNGKVLVVTQEPWGYPHLI